MCAADLPATGASFSTSTPTTNASQHVETAANSSRQSTQTASARLQNITSSDKNLQQQKCTKALQRDSSNDNIKGRRQTNDMSCESGVTRPDRDVPTSVSKQHNDFNIDIRTMPSQLPPQRLPTTDVRQPTSAFGDRFSEPSSIYREQQSSSHIRAEEFLQVSYLSVFTSSHFHVTAVRQGVRG